MTNKPLSLNELINDVANELRTAKSLSQTHKPVMEFTECELELQVNVSVEGNAGIKFWVLDIGGGGKQEKSHTIKIKFNAVDSNRLAFVSKGRGKSKEIDRQ